MLAAATAASVAATFAVSAAASLVIRAVEARVVTPVDGPCRRPGCWYGRWAPRCWSR